MQCVTLLVCVPESARTTLMRKRGKPLRLQVLQVLMHHCDENIATEQEGQESKYTTLGCNCAAC